MDKNKQVVIEVDHHEVSSMESAMKGTAAAFFYGICSITSAFVSKGLMDTMEFDFPVFIMVVQMMTTILVLEILCVLRVVELPAYTLKRGLSFAAPAIFYGTNSILALTALSHMNIAMYGVLKRCVPISTMILSYVVLGKGFPSKTTMVFVLLLTMGCVIAGFGDLGFNMTAYICGIGSNFTQAMYLLLVQKYSSERRMSVPETLQLNSFNTLPLLAATALLNGEMQSVQSYNRMGETWFIVLFILSVSVGMLLNYSLFLCANLTSALTTSVVGGLKALFQTLLGLITFGGVSHNFATYIGISMNLSGGIGYIWTKYKENISLKDMSFKRVMSFTSFMDRKFNGHSGQNGILNQSEGEKISS